MVAKARAEKILSCILLDLDMIMTVTETLSPEASCTGWQHWQILIG